MLRLFLSLPILLTACLKDETISGFVDPQIKYDLIELDGETSAMNAQISFPKEGTITGRAPCNSFSASQEVPYPWFELGPIAATRSVCPDIALERQFLEALARMTLIETLGDVIVLRNDEGEEMVFRSRQE